MATISVVIPTRNDAGPLAVCLAALARQSRRPDTVIVVDNGSKDGTAAACAAAGVHRIPADVAGIAAATALGFDAADTDIIARLDTDSVPPADWLERVETLLAAAAPPTAVSGPGDFYGGTALARWAGRSIWIAGYHRVVGLLLGHPPLFGSNFAMHSEAWALIRDAVHRGLPAVHDDLDISYQLPPQVAVIWEPTLRVGVSARPFESAGAVWRRLAMAWTTFAVEFSADPPLARRRRRRGYRRGLTGRN